MRWMSCVVVAVFVGCDPGSGGVGVPALDDEPTVVGEGWTDEAWETPGVEPEAPDLSAYDDAWIQLTHPQAGESVSWGVPYAYEAIVTNPDGATLSVDAVQWWAADDPDFHGEALVFDSDTLSVGIHEITVTADLPNGDTLAHTVGGVLVQSPWAGTYAGLFKVDGTVNNITIACTGAGVVVLDPLGQDAEGDADCLVSLLGVDIPMTWVLELDNADGVVSGTGGVELAGLFTWDLPAEGSIDAASQTLDVTFEGPIPFIGDLSASFEAPRISLDSGLE